MATASSEPIIRWLRQPARDQVQHLSSAEFLLSFSICPPGRLTASLISPTRSALKKLVGLARSCVARITYIRDELRVDRPAELNHRDIDANVEPYSCCLLRIAYCSLFPSTE